MPVVQCFIVHAGALSLMIVFWNQILLIGHAFVSVKILFVIKFKMNLKLNLFEVKIKDASQTRI